MLQMHAARPEELPRIRAIWSEVFGDDETFLDRFLELCPPERIQVLLEDGEVQSFLALIPATLVSPDAAPAKMDYVYALCTRPEGRGKGFGGQILNYADYFSRIHWCEVMATVPAETSLHEGFFRRWGYREGFTTWVSWPADLPEAAGELTPVTAAEYGRLREKLLSSLPHAAYNEAVLEFQKWMCEVSGGGLYALPGGVAAVELEGDGVIVKELLAEDVPAAAACIAAAFPGKALEVRTPRPTGMAGEERREFGMWKPLDAKPRPALVGGGGYLGLAFD